MKLKLKDGREVEFYVNSREMPILKWQKFLTEMIRASELGPDFGSITQKITLAVDMVKDGRVEDFNSLLKNMQLQLYYCFRGIDPKLVALSYRVKAIGGLPFVGELPAEVFDELIVHPDLTVGLLEELTEEFRKK